MPPSNPTVSDRNQRTGDQAVYRARLRVGTSFAACHNESLSLGLAAICSAQRHPDFIGGPDFRPKLQSVEEVQGAYAKRGDRGQVGGSTRADKVSVAKGHGRMPPAPARRQQCWSDPATLTLAASGETPQAAIRTADRRRTAPRPRSARSRRGGRAKRQPPTRNTDWRVPYGWPHRSRQCFQHGRYGPETALLRPKPARQPPDPTCEGFGVLVSRRCESIMLHER
jgi:hypothetical protein